jgi:hypothetical protein
VTSTCHIVTQPRRHTFFLLCEFRSRWCCRLWLPQRSRRMSKPTSGHGIQPPGATKDSRPPPKTRFVALFACLDVFALHISAKPARTRIFRLCYLQHASLRTVFSRLQNGFHPTVSLSFTGPGSLWTLPSCIACKPIYATLSKFASSRSRREKYKDFIHPLSVSLSWLGRLSYLHLACLSLAVSIGKLTSMDHQQQHYGYSTLLLHY